MTQKCNGSRTRINRKVERDEKVGLIDAKQYVQDLESGKETLYVGRFATRMHTIIYLLHISSLYVKRFSTRMHTITYLLNIYKSIKYLAFR